MEREMINETIEQKTYRLLKWIYGAQPSFKSIKGTNDFKLRCAMIEMAIAEEREATQAAPVGYLAATELSRLAAGYDATLRSARFGPSYIDGDVPVFLGHAAPKDEVSE